MAKKINGQDLLDQHAYDEQIDDCPDIPTVSETPFDKGFDLLSETDGKRLDIMMRTTPAIVKAGGVTLAHQKRFPHMRFIPELYSQLQRYTVSIGGKGRNEIVTTVQAGAGVPPTYYENKSDDDKRSFIPLGDNDGE